MNAFASPLPRLHNRCLSNWTGMKTKGSVSGFSHLDARRWGAIARSPWLALPVLIKTLRDHGYTFVSVSSLMGKTSSEVMPPLTFWQYVRAIPDSIAFSTLAADWQLYRFRLLSRRHPDERAVDPGRRVRHHRPVAPSHREASPGFNPRIAVLIRPTTRRRLSFRTIRSVLHSDYENLRVIVIDDGSTDDTFEVAARCLCARNRRWTRAGTDQGERRQGRCAELRTRWS